MLRYIFFLAFGYIVIKMLRVFIDPMFESKTVRNVNPNVTPPKEEKKSTLGDYVDYEEVK